MIIIPIVAAAGFTPESFTAATVRIFEDAVRGDIPKAGWMEG